VYQLAACRLNDRTARDTRRHRGRCGPHVTLARIKFWDALHDRYVAPACAALDPEQEEAAAKAGLEMPFEAAVAEARSLAAPAR
jgi:hypothetical protein